jgi:hypothetical protein
MGAAACGRIGSPRPPEFVIPMSPEPVKVENTPEGTKITWKRPKQYVGGDPLDDLAGFRVQRVCLPDAAFSVIATVLVEDQQRFRKTPSFSIVDKDAPLGLQCRYQVIAFTADAYTSPPAESEDFIRSFPGAVP